MSGTANSQRGATTSRVWTASNVITIIRILLVPVFVAVLLAPWPDWLGLSALDGGWKNIVAAGVFVFISCTDWLDGYLARSRNEVTDFGKFMDPLADKILVCAALVSLVELGSLPTWVVLVILAREFIVSGVRMMAATKGVVIAASMLGKFKTVFQMIAIVLFTVKDSHAMGTLGDAFSDGLWVVSWAVMLVALVLTVASMVDYLYKGRELLGFAGDAGLDEHGGACGEGEGPSRPAPDGALAESVIAAAAARGLTIATAESLTGGGIGAALTAVGGSSAVYRGGVVSYVNEVKHGVLGVDRRTLEQDGAVSQDTAIQMATGARKLLGADLAVSVTGIAGPTGAEPGKPVGTVWMGLASADRSFAKRFAFEGGRDEVRRQTVETALSALLGEMDSVRTV